MCIIIIISIIIIIIIVSRSDIFTVVYMSLASIWKKSMKAELESGIRYLGLAYIKVPTKVILEGSKDGRKSVT